MYREAEENGEMERLQSHLVKDQYNDLTVITFLCSFI